MKFAGSRSIFIIILLLLLPAFSFAQKLTLSGYMKDAESGETLIAATVFVKEAGISATTNSYGFYSISAPAGKYTVIFNYVGYASLAVAISLTENTHYDALLTSSTKMQEVEITAQRKDANVKSTEMGTVSLSIDRIKTLPVIFGETDILKTLQLMPGVQSAGEGNAGFYVRGGGPDQNLILLDDAVVYNSGHLFGFFSVFNSDALKSTTLIKGGMPANYGGRLSSVVDVSMKEGNDKEYHAQGGIGLIASRLTLEGPIKKEKGSFMVSGRRTYIDVLVKPFVSKTSSFSGSGYYFYDFNAKANYKLSSKDRVYFSSYFGRDKFTFVSSSQSFAATIPWGNSTASLRWNHQFNDRLFMNTTTVYNDYGFSFAGEQNNFSVKLTSGIRDYNAKMDFDYFSSYNHHFKAGWAYIWHKFSPSQVSGSSDSVTFQPDNALVKYGHEAAAYVMDDFELGKKWKINAGIRYSLFAQAGPYWQYTYQPGSDYRIKTDSVHYGTGSVIKTYSGLEPRLNVRYEVSSNSSLKGSITRSNQYLHLVSNNGSTLPTDTWVPSTYLVKPQRAWQYALGYFKNLKENTIETSVEVYYKQMKNLVEFRQGYVPNSIRDQQLDYVFGNGNAYGAEFFVNKTKGKFTGWVGYTLSWTYRKFPDLNNGIRYPAKYDRRHDLSVVASYQKSKKWTYSAVFIFGSGSAITLPQNYYVIENKLVPQYGTINGFRLFPYHRLDVAAVYTPKGNTNKKWKGSWTFSIYNIYNQHNAYFLYVDTGGSTNTGINPVVKKVSIFPVLPSITYNFSL